MKKSYCSILFWLAACAAFASSTNQLPKFDEVYQLLRSNLNGFSDADLNRAAVQGLLAELTSSAMLVGEAADAKETSSASVLGKSIVYDGSFAYFRVLKVETNLAGELMTAYREVAATNKSKIKGVILDLRFAGGSDFPAAAAAADCFLNSDQPLLESEGTVVRSTKKDNAINVPLAALINSQTSEAAEALAAILRQTGTGLLLGSPSAGRASVFKEFPLTDGGKLRIASGEVKLGDGTVFNGGIKPDIAVNTTPKDEMAYWEHPYQAPDHSGTNGATGTNDFASIAPTNGGVFRRYSEAELVREQREGVDLEAEFSRAGRFQTDPDVKPVLDPALSRALDLLKGLAVVQHIHPG